LIASKSELILLRKKERTNKGLFKAFETDIQLLPKLLMFVIVSVEGDEEDHGVLQV
jgi:hypothetical protein